MDLIADRGRRVTVEELNTTSCWRTPASRRRSASFDDMLIVDVDAHHYENENFREIPAVHGKRRVPAAHHVGRAQGGRGAVTATQVGYQDMGGRVTRYPLRGSEKTDQQRRTARRRSSAIAGWTR